MAPAAESVDRRRRSALAAGGDHTAAFGLAIRSALTTYDAGRAERGALHDAQSFLDHLGEVERAVLVATEAVTGWANDGYDVASIAAALNTVVATGHDSAAALAARIAEQVVTDDDLADDIKPLAPVLHRAAETGTDGDHIRLTLCLTDLQVRTGTDPQDAFATLVRRALRYDLEESLAALVLRRAGH